MLIVDGDMIHALPSWTKKKLDILRDVPSTAQPWFPKDSAWPSDPPRWDPYCYDSAQALVAHATASSWAGAPPMWIACGHERLRMMPKSLHKRPLVTVCPFFIGAVLVNAPHLGSDLPTMATADPML